MKISKGWQQTLRTSVAHRLLTECNVLQLQLRSLNKLVLSAHASSGTSNSHNYSNSTSNSNSNSNINSTATAGGRLDQSKFKDTLLSILVLVS